MESNDRRSSSDVVDDLLNNPKSYSFYQAIRLLRLHTHNMTGEALESFYHDQLRVRPQLSLGFPATDLTDLFTKEQGNKNVQFLIEATFMGLYGASSPLPTIYTEELLSEFSEDRSVTRDFIDIVNNDYYIQFFKVWSRSRLMIKTVEERDERWGEWLNCLLGYGNSSTRESFPQECRQLRHIGLLTQYPRSALGLQTYLRDFLGISTVFINQCVLSIEKIPSEQRFCLGVQANCIGEQSWLGEELQGRMSKIEIVISELRSEQFLNLLPGEKLAKEIDNIVKSYLLEPIQYDLCLRLKADVASVAELGANQWSSLGKDTWSFSFDHLKDAGVVFQNGRN
ncbi:type VI secretion system baseplate subunit TssG [Celerinatantimonas sp. MCCC 1A17872]|uniref:type VI secretion system baseplate subunit TssG n=1 Tax=Celerinatantimonas sp. MCCC 1A17872 TaxID=3177514 RepID=UPI0038C42C6C